MWCMGKWQHWGYIYGFPVIGKIFSRICNMLPTIKPWHENVFREWYQRVSGPHWIPDDYTLHDIRQHDSNTVLYLYSYIPDHLQIP